MNPAVSEGSRRSQQISKTVSALIIFIACAAASALAASPDDPLTIAGVITIGQPLSIPECHSKAPVGAADFGGGTVYASTDEELGEAFKTVWFRGEPPPVGFHMRVSVQNGVVTGASFETLGVKDQEDVLNRLKAKFGKPSLLERRILQNAFGVRVNSYYAEWEKLEVYVQFDGVTDRIDRGWVMVETAADRAAQLKARKQYAHQRPRL
jgi:hypothetical protein